MCCIALQFELAIAVTITRTNVCIGYCICIVLLCSVNFLLLSLLLVLFFAVPRDVAVILVVPRRVTITLNSIQHYFIALVVAMLPG